MKKKLLSIFALFAAVLVITAAVFCCSNFKTDDVGIEAEKAVALNEIEHLNAAGETEKAAEKLYELQAELDEYNAPQKNNSQIIIMCCIGLTAMAAAFGYIYFGILRPFNKLSGFAAEIARGNFDIPLKYERSNYFGEFTWAFDAMRREITASRKREKEAAENNKTVIATLAHDIKTPIASIRAYSEGLMAYIDSTPEKRTKYLSVLIRKCDEVTKLTDDLFLHSLSDLDKIRISPEKFEICSFLENAVNEIATGKNDIIFRKPDFTADIIADKSGITRIAENIIFNARKYAKTKIDISVYRTKSNIELRFRDFGKGIPDADMPFIFDKFYRGRNCSNEEGSGLGLYIIKYLTEKMDGNITLNNHIDGLEVIVSFPETD